ncbi:PTS mannose transporter subunit IIA [Clostridium tertium]|uniref:PTS system mannose-specific EIIAB component n=1 Tax=Clostridium tertium TaxID=1559 RepID=A0A6N3G8P7_9CLOT
MNRAILLISHGKLAKEIKESIKMITGTIDDIYYTCLESGDQSEEFIDKLRNEIDKLSKYEEVIVFADLYGGSPCNNAMKYLVNDDKYRIISGMNLSMVISASLNEEEHVDSLLNIGRNAIIDVKDIYNSMKYDDED